MGEEHDQTAAFFHGSASGTNVLLVLLQALQSSGTISSLLWLLCQESPGGTPGTAGGKLLSVLCPQPW